jgi:hypothetical protein
MKVKANIAQGRTKDQFCSAHEQFCNNDVARLQRDHRTLLWTHLSTSLRAHAKQSRRQRKETGLLRRKGSSQ